MSHSDRRVVFSRTTVTSLSTPTDIRAGRSRRPRKPNDRPAKKRKKIVADGEVSGQAPAIFRVVQMALSVFAPASGSP